MLKRTSLSHLGLPAPCGNSNADDLQSEASTKGRVCLQLVYDAVGSALTVTAVKGQDFTGIDAVEPSLYVKLTVLPKRR